MCRGVVVMIVLAAANGCRGDGSMPFGGADRQGGGAGSDATNGGGGTGGVPGAPASGSGGQIAGGTGGLRGLGSGGLSGPGGAAQTGGAAQAGGGPGGLNGTGGIQATGGAGPTCRIAGGACANAADCCSPLVCLGGVCQAAPTDVCGDGRCTGSESTATCCGDCPCVAGTACNGTSCVPVETSLMTWDLTNLCFNGETTELRFFDGQNGMVWPDSTMGPFLLPPGATVSPTLECITRATVCYGARQPLHGFYWGVDSDGSQPCTGCCFTCATATVTGGPLYCL
jgi:hypothetical protein